MSPPDPMEVILFEETLLEDEDSIRILNERARILAKSTISVPMDVDVDNAFRHYINMLKANWGSRPSADPYSALSIAKTSFWLAVSNFKHRMRT